MSSNNYTEKEIKQATLKKINETLENQRNKEQNERIIEGVTKSVEKAEQRYNNEVKQNAYSVPETNSEGLLNKTIQQQQTDDSVINPPNNISQKKNLLPKKNKTLKKLFGSVIELSKNVKSKSQPETQQPQSQPETHQPQPETQQPQSQPETQQPQSQPETQQPQPQTEALKSQTTSGRISNLFKRNITPKDNKLPQLQDQSTIGIIGNTFKRNTTPKDLNPQQIQSPSEPNNTEQPKSTFGKLGNIFKGKTIQSVFSSFANKNNEIIDKNVDKHIKLNEELKKYNIKASLVSGIRVNEGAMVNTSMILMTQKGERQIEEFITSVIENDKKYNNGKINFLKFSLLDGDKERSSIIDSLREIKNFGVYDNLIVDDLFMSRLAKIIGFINNEPLLKDYSKIFDACKKLTKNLYVTDTAQPEKVKDVIINIIWIINYLISVFEVKLFIMSEEDKQIKSDKFIENCKSITSVILFTYYLLVLTIGGNYNNYKNGEVVNINTNIDMTILKSIVVFDYELPQEVLDKIEKNIETYKKTNEEENKIALDNNYLWSFLGYKPEKQRLTDKEQIETKISNTLKNSKALGFDIDVLSIFKKLCNDDIVRHLKKYFFIFNLIYSEIYELKNDTTFSKNESGNFFKINDNVINLFNEYKSNQLTENATYNKLRKNIDIVYDYTEIINVDNPRYEFIKDTKNPKINKMNYNVNNRLIGGNDGGMKTRPLSKQNKTRKIYK
jgi:hypothetical protein